MTVPALIGAGDGLALATGTATVGKTGCTADNLLLIHLMWRGTTGDFSISNVTNVEKQDGTLNVFSGVFSAGGVGTGDRHEMYICRVTANGTCSFDLTVGASGEDLVCRFYEFGGVALGANQGAGTLENDTGTEDHGGAEGTTTLDDVAVITNGPERLACQFIALDTNQTPGALAGASGGTWAVAATFADALGTLQLQTATMSSAGTIDGGTVSVSSTAAGYVGLALIPATVTGIPEPGIAFLSGVGW